MTEIRNVFDLGSRALSAQNAAVEHYRIKPCQCVQHVGQRRNRVPRPAPGFSWWTRPRPALALPRRAPTGLSRWTATRRASFAPTTPMRMPRASSTEAAVNVEEEMVEMLEASRSYQNTLEANVHLADADDPHPFDGR